MPGRRKIKFVKKRKPIPRKRIDKFQNKEIKKMKKQIKLLTDIQEPQRIKLAYDSVQMNGTRTASQNRLTKHEFFVNKSGAEAETSTVPEAVYRSGDQLNIGNITLHLTLYDINNAFRWRMLVVQYKERPELLRTKGNANNYNTNGELDDMLKWHGEPTNLSSIQRLNYNIISPHKLKKDIEHSAHILYDRTFTGKNRTIKITGADNEIKTYKIIVKPKMRKLTFKYGTDDSPYRGDIVAYIWNDYPYSGSRDYGFTGLEQTNHPEKFKRFQLFAEYNIKDDSN